MVDSNFASIIRDAPKKKKNGKMWEFFPSGGPPPLPPVWEPHVCEKKIKVYFAF